MILAYRNVENMVCGLSFVDFPARLQVGVPATLKVSLSCNGHPWPDEPINWSFLSPGFDLSDQVTWTNRDGLASVTITPEQTGPLTIRASGKGMVAEKTTVIEDRSVEISLTSARPQIGVGEVGLLTASLTSAGSPFSGADLVWSITSGDNQGFLSNESAATDASGLATANLTGLSEGVVTIEVTARVDGRDYSASTTVDVRTNPIYLDLTVTSAIIAINDIAGLALTLRRSATALDVSRQDKVPLANIPVSWAISAGETFGALSNEVMSTNALGQATSDVKGLAAGPVNVTVTVTVDGRDYSACTTVEVRDSVQPRDVTLTLTPDTSQIKVGESGGLTFLLHQDGIPNNGVTVNWSISAGALYGSLSDTQPATDNNGQATARLTGWAQGPVTVTATVTLEDESYSAGATIQVQNNAPLLTLTADSPLTGIGESDQLTFSLTQNDAVLGNVAVDWTISSGEAFGQFLQTQDTTDAAGEALAALEGLAVGSVTVMAAVTVDGQGYSVSTTVRVDNQLPVLTLTPDSSHLPVGGNTLLTLTLTQNGQPLNGVNVVWAVTAGSTFGTFGGTANQTNAAGQDVGTLSGTAAGSITVSATVTVDGRDYGASATVQVENNPPLLSLSAGAAAIAVGQNAPLTFTLERNGSPLNGQMVTWGIVSGDTFGSLTGTSSPTDAQGQASGTFNGTAAGSVTITASVTVGGQSYSASTTIQVRNNAPTLTLSPADRSISVAGSTLLTFSIQQNGQALNNAAVTWAIISGEASGSLSAAGSATNAAGEASGTLNGTAAGSVTVTATVIVDGQSYSAGATIQVINNQPVLTLSAATQSIMVGGNTGLTLAASQNGAALSGLTVNWAISSGAPSGTLNSKTNTIDSSGQAGNTLTGTAAGPVTITATVTVDGQSLSAGVTVQVQDNTPVLSLSVANSAIKVTDSTALTFIASLNGQPLASTAVDWSIISGDTFGSLSTTSNATDSNGTAANTLTGAAEGSITITAAVLVGGQTYTASVTVRVEAQSDLPSLVLTADKTVITVGGAAGLAFILTQNGTPLNNAAVTWALGSGNSFGNLSGTGATTNASGQATGTLNGTAAGSVTVTASATVNGQVYSASVTVQVENNPPVLTLIAGDTSVSVAGSTTLSFSASQNGSPLDGATITWTITDGGSSGNLNPSDGTTDPSGQASATLNVTASGSITVTATVTVDGQTYSTTVTVQAENNPPVLTLSTAASAIRVGQGTALTLKLTQNGAALNDVAVTWAVSDGGSYGSLGTLSNATASGGTAANTLSGTAAGPVTITAAVTLNGQTYNASVTVQVENNPPVLTLTAGTSPITVGGSATLNFIASQNGAALDGATVTWAINAGNTFGNLSPSSGTTDSSGQALATLDATAAGPITVTATIIVDGQTCTASLTVQSENNQPILTLAADGSSTLVGGNTVLTFTLNQNSLAVSGANVTWAISSGAAFGNLSGTANTTNASGQATGALNGMAAGPVTVTASVLVDGQNYSASTSVQVEDNPPVLSLSAGGATIMAGGNTSLSFTLSRNSTPIVGQTVTWAISDGIAFGNFSAADAVTGGGGLATAILTGLAAGPVTVMAEVTIDGQTYAASVTVQVRNNPPVLNLNAADSSIMTGGSTRLTLTLRQNNSPLADTAVTWDLSPGSSFGSLTGAEADTDGSGQATATLNGTAAGSVTITATVIVDGQSYSANATVQVEDNPPSLTLTAGSGYINVSGNTSLTFTLTRDGAPIVGESVTWNITEGDVNGNLTGTDFTTDNSGQATNTLNGTAAGAVTVTASVTIGGQTYSAAATVQVLNNPPVLIFSPGATPIPVDGSTSLNLTLTQNGVGAGGESVAWAITEGSGALSTSNGSTNGSGQAEVIFTPGGIGTVTVTATVLIDGQTYTASTTVEVRNNPPALSLSAGDPTITVGGTTTFSFKLTQNGQPLSGQSVTWALDGVSGALTASNGMTDAAGQATATVEGTAAGSITLTATVIVDDQTYMVSSTVQVGNNAPTLSLTAAASPVYVGGNTGLTFTLTQNSAALNGVNVTWAVASGGPYGSLSGQDPTTDASGQAVATLNATAAGSITITATVTVDSQSYSASTSIQVLNNAPVLSLSAAASPILVGGDTQLTFTLSQNGAALNGASVIWVVASGGAYGNLSGESAITDGTGQAIATLNGTAAGSVTVTATVTVDGKFCSASSTVQVQNRPPVLSVTSASSSIFVNGSTLVTLSLTQNGSTLSGTTVNWALSSGAALGNLSAAGNTTGNDGRATATLNGTAAGSVTVTVTVIVDGQNYSAGATVQIKNNPPVLTLAAGVSPILVNQSTTMTFALTQDGTALASQAVTWAISAGSAYGSLSVIDNTTNSSGRATATLNGTVAGSITVTATVTMNSQTYSASATVQVHDNPPVLSLIATSSSISVLGSTGLTFSLTQNGSAVNNQAINWAVSSGSTHGNLSAAGSTTNSSGQATATLNGTSAGSVTVTATVAMSGQNYSVSTTVQVRNNLPVLGLVPVLPSIFVGGGTQLNFALSLNTLPLGNASVDWTITAGAAFGVLSDSGSTTNIGGQASTTLTGVAAGAVTVTATVTIDGQSFSASATVQVLNNLPLLTLVPVTPSIFVGASTDLNFNLALNGLPLGGASVSWSITAGAAFGTLGGNGTTTGSGGLATNTLTATAAGSVTVTATVTLLGLSYSASATVRINDNTPILGLSPTLSPIFVGGTTQLTFNLTQNGLPLTGTTVAWAVKSGSAYGSLSSTADTTNGGGQATATLTGTAAGAVTITAAVTVSGQNYSASTTVQVLNNPPLLTLTSALSSIYVGENTELTFRLAQNAQPLVGASVTWSIGAGASLGNLSGTGNPTNDGGYCTATLNATAAGSITVLATVAVGGLSYNTSVVVQVLNNPPVLTLTPTSASILVNAGTQVNFALTRNGQPLSGSTVTWALSTGVPFGVLSAMDNTTNASGLAAAILTGTAAGSVTVTATVTVGGQNYSASTTVLVLNNPPALTLTTALSSIYVGSNTGLTFSLTQNGLAVSGLAVTWDISSGNSFANLSGAGMTTDSGGQASATLNGTAAGLVIVTATVTVSGQSYSASATVLVRNNPPALTLTSALSSIYVDGTTALSFGLTQNGAGLSGVSVTWDISSGNSLGSLSGTGNPTDAGGNSSAVLSAAAAGSITVTATVTVGGLNYSASATVQVRNNPPVLTLTPGSSLLTVGNYTPLSFSVTQNGSPLSGATVTWAITSGNTFGNLTDLGGTTNISGQAAATLNGTAAGLVIVIATVTVSGQRYSASTTIQVQNNPPVLSLAAGASPILVGGNTGLTFGLTQNDAPLSGATVTWAITSGSAFGNLTGQGAATNADGRAWATLNATAAGSIIITATVTVAGQSYSASATVQVQNNPPVLALTAGASPILMGGSTGLTFGLTRNGAAISGAAVSWAITSGSAYGNLSGVGTATNAGGEATATLNATAAGSIMITATVIVAGQSYSASATVQVQNNPPVLTLTTGTSPIVVGGSTPLTLGVTQNGSAISGAAVTWDITSGSAYGSLTGQGTATNSGGQATATLNATAAGSVTILATVTLAGQAYSANLTVPVRNNPPVLLLTRAGANIFVGNSTSLTFNLTQNGAALSGKAVTWSISTGAAYGSLSGSTVTTNSSGQATATLTGLAAGSVTVTATVTVDGQYYSANTTIQVQNNPPVLSITGPSIIILNGSGVLTLTVTQNGQPVANTAVTWAITGGLGLGSLSSPQLVTNANGQATVGLRVLLSLGLITIQATALGSSTSTTVLVVL